MPVEKGRKISVSWFEKGGLLTRKSRQAAFVVNLTCQMRAFGRRHGIANRSIIIGYENE